MPKPDDKVPSNDSQPLNFIQKILALFLGEGDPEAEKKRLLKAIGKDVSASRYKFYRQKTDEVLPGLAKLFYETYKIVGAAQVLLQNADQTGSLKSYIITASLSKEQLEVYERLADESICERAKTMAVKDLQESVKNDMVRYFSGFDTETMRVIDSRYTMILSFIAFINFDYYFLLKKFDSNVSERNFTYNPKFETIAAEYVSDDVKDFLEVFMAIDLEADWKDFFAALKGYKQMDVVNVDAWIKLVNILKDVRRSEILPKLVQLIDMDPFWTPTVRRIDEHIIEAHIQKVKTQTEVAIQKVVQEKRNSKIDELSRIVFGTTVIVRTKNYTDKANMAFSKKMLGGFIHVQALNYLKAFLLDYFKKDVRELINTFLIRGQWSTNFNSQVLSESFHALMATADQIVEFDDGLADDGELGSRLRLLMSKSDRDKEQIKYVRTMLKDINDKAQFHINGAATNLISMGKTLKSIIEDYDKPVHELIINWKEVEAAADHSVKQKTTDVYKKIYYFVSLLQYFVKQDMQ